MRQDIPPKDRVSRFARRNAFVAKTNSLRPKFFVPRRNSTTGRPELSVCWSENLSDAALWAICTQHFDAHAPDPAVGCARGLASSCYEQQLSCEVNGVPYREHTNIVGWKTDGPANEDEEKGVWLRQAQELAACFKFVRRS